MTTTDPTHAEGQLDAGQHAEPADGPDTFLDYAAREYSDLAERVPRMPMDVEIAAQIGVGFEIRALRDGVQLLTAAIRDLEGVYADSTATIKAALAEVSPQRLFGLEENEQQQRQAEESVVPQKAAGG